MKNNPSLHKATQSIQNAVRSQSRIIDDLMDVSRIRTGKPRFALRHACASGCSRHRTEPTFSFASADAPSIQADPTRRTRSSGTC